MDNLVNVEQFILLDVARGVIALFNGNVRGEFAHLEPWLMQVTSKMLTNPHRSPNSMAFFLELLNWGSDLGVA